MGWTVADVKASSMWEFMAAVEGYVKANSADEAKMSDNEAHDLFEWLKSKE